MTLSDAARLKLLEPPVGKVRVVLDTDTYNEIDDQFALVQMLLSKDRFDVEAIYAAPFFNARADSPGHGMELSYQEILRLLENGMSNKLIARALEISDETVKWHLKNLFSKLSAGTRKHVVDRARLLGLIGV